MYARVIIIIVIFRRLIRDVEAGVRGARWGKGNLKYEIMKSKVNTNPRPVMFGFVYKPVRSSFSVGLQSAAEYQVRKWSNGF